MKSFDTMSALLYATSNIRDGNTDFRFGDAKEVLSSALSLG